MPIRPKLTSFLRLRGADRFLICEAIFALGSARAMVLLVPFRFLAKWLARAPDTDRRDDELIRRVRTAVTVAARNVPWNAVCLPQAMAAKAMLARRGHGSALHFGAAIEAGGGISAHAWLTAGEVVVVGAEGMQRVSHLARLG
jgi:hypothetical protein